MGMVDYRGEELTTQTPGMAYLPSAAFRSMTLALFWERSNSGFGVVASAMMGLERRGKAQGKGFGWDEWRQGCA